MDTVQTLKAEPQLTVGDRPIDRINARWIFALLFATALIRGAALYYLGAGLEHDPDSYRRYAESLLDQGTFLRNDRLSAWRPPLYPVILAGCLAIDRASVFWIGLVHLIAGLLTVWLVVATGRRWNLGRAALLAGILLAIDPILIHESTQLMTETIAALLAALAIYCATRSAERASNFWTAALGLSVGLAILCRPTFLLWSLCLLPLTGRIKAEPYQPRSLGIYTLAILAALAPWALRNALQLGQPIVTTTHGGYTLLLANNPFFYEFLKTRKQGKSWDSREFVADWEKRLKEADIENEVDEDELAYRLARKNVRDNPLAFGRACLFRFSSFWRLAPMRIGRQPDSRGQIMRLGITLWYFAVIALATLGLREFERQQKPPTWVMALLLAVSFTAVHTIYWSDLRMRAPVMPAVTLFAAAGWHWRSAAQKRRSSQDQTT